MTCVDDFETSCFAAKVSSPSTSHVFLPVEVPNHSNRRSRSCRKMAQSRVFTLLGDSNVRRYINKTSVRASQDIKSAQILSCSRLEIFKEVHRALKPGGRFIVSFSNRFFPTKVIQVTRFFRQWRNLSLTRRVNLLKHPKRIQI